MARLDASLKKKPSAPLRAAKVISASKRRLSAAANELDGPMRTEDGLPISAPVIESLDIQRTLAAAETARSEVRSRKLETILGKAMDVFAKDGYAGFSTRRVAAEAGISLSTLQHYFGNRENLLEATIRSLLDGYAKHYDALVARQDLSPQERYEIVIDHLLSEVKRPSVCAFFFEMWALTQHEEKIGRIVEEIYTAYRHTWAGMFQGLNPAMSPERAHILATLVAAQIEGTMVFTYRGGKDLPPWDDMCREIKQLWLRLAAE